MFLIRKGVQEDVSSIAEVHICSWNEAYLALLPKSYIDKKNSELDRHMMWAQIICEPNVQVWVAVDDCHQVVGFIGYYAHDRCYEITTLYVLPDYHRRGIGTTLMQVSLAAISRSAPDAEFYLWALEANLSAIKFYQKHGFERSGDISEEVYEGTKITDIKMIKTRVVQNEDMP